jgi:hypothetical protein
MTTTQQMAEFLLGADPRAAVAACWFTETGSWHEAIALAQAWKVVPQLSARMQSLCVTLSDEDTRALRREFLRVHGVSASRALKAVLAICELERAGIPAAAFKGVASIAVLYGGPKHRSIGDGDLLILRQDIPGALACLERNGFTRKGTETLSQYVSFVKNAPRFAGNEAIALYGEDGSEIDLHWNISGSGLRVEQILQRSVTVELMGAAIPVVDSMDGFLLTVHHAIREDLAMESVCRDLLDVRLWCDRLEQNGELECAMKRSAQAGSQVAVLAVAGLLSGYDDSTAVARAARSFREAASPAQRRSAALLIELFHYQMGKGRLEKDLLYLVHSRPWRQILKGLASDWTGYRRSMQTLDEQLGDRQPLHKRFVLLARSIPGLQAARLARELARVKYRSQ